MSDLSYTLVGEGPSDRALMPILDWLLARSSSLVFQPQWPDLRLLRQPVKSFRDRIRVAVELQPCDVLFVHRDADREPRDLRVRQIQRALTGLSSRLLSAWSQ